MKLIIIFLITIPAYGALSPFVVKESALRHHPVVLAALEKMRASQEAVQGARGAFDAQIVSDYKRQVKHSFKPNPDYNTTLSRTQLEKPLQIANSKIYAGSEQISNPNGLLAPIYHTGNPIGQTGNYSLIGLKLSLWKNFTLDPSRAAFKHATYNAKMARAEKNLTVLDIGRLGQLAYWEWVTATKVKNAFEVLLKNGEIRNKYLVARNKKGDVAQILVTENEQYIAGRKKALQSARERLLRSEYALALFYRDEYGGPILPHSAETFEDYPDKLATLMEGLDLNSSIDQLISNRPDMMNLSLTIEKTEVDLELAKQDLRPQIDVTTEYFKRTVDHRPEMPLDYLMVMIQVRIPIERNLGNGNIAAARARQMVAQKKMTYDQEVYKFEVSALRQSLQMQLEQVTQSEIEFSKTRELVAAENFKFKTGGGSLFLVNLREEAQARAEASFQEARLAFMDMLLTYQALVSTVDD